MEKRKPSIVKKLSTRAMGLTKELLKSLVTDGPVKIARFIGQATDVKRGETQYGPYVGFVGKFEGYNKAGDMFRSYQCFLPCNATAEGMAVEIEEEKRRAAEAGDMVNPIRFAFDVYAQADDRAGVGYAYTMESIIEQQAADVLADVRAALPSFDGDQKLLPETSEAPKKETKKSKKK